MSNYQFEGTVPSIQIWVDANAAPGGDGSAEHPFNTIQAAVNLAVPGTAIMVKAGEYHENIAIPRAVSGTSEAPIYLVSADGPQAAHIIAPSSASATIGGGGTENFIVDGFWVTGGKNGIQFSQNGFDYTDMIKNIVVTNNVIDGFVEDGVKLNGGDTVTVSGNTIKGGNDEGIDFVTIVNGVISGNDVSGNTGTSAAIFAKFGSENIVIKDNYVHDNAAAGISVGGYVNATLAMRPGYETFQAKNVLVEGNVVIASGKTPIALYGASDVTVTGNYLQANSLYYTAVFIGSSNATMYGTFGSHNVTITDNFLTEHRKPLVIDANSDGVTFENNTAYLTSDLLQSLHLTTGTPPTPVDDTPPAENELPQPLPQDDPAADTGPSPQMVRMTELLGVQWLEGQESTSTVKNGIGTNGADLMVGRADFYRGGEGDDTYTVGQATIGNVVEAAGDGIDTVRASGKYLVLPDNVENLVLTATNGALLIGNALDNRIVGNVGNDHIVGAGGSNLLTGNGGADHFFVAGDAGLTRITDFGGDDQLHIAGLGFSSFEALKAAMVEIDGAVALDLGNNRTVVLNDVAISDLTAEQFGFGSASLAAPSGTNTGDKLSPAASTHIAVGTSANDYIQGNGSSILAGGAGDDRYVIKGDGDHILELANGGIDTVLLRSDHFVLDSAVENVIVRVDDGAHVTGNGLANIITGGAGADVIEGSGSADILTGGAGADLFVYRSAGDGGDVITDFKVGEDHLDVSQMASGMTFNTEVAGQGLAIYGTVDGHSFLLCTLTSVTSALPVSDLLA